MQALFLSLGCVNPVGSNQRIQAESGPPKAPSRYTKGLDRSSSFFVVFPVKGHPSCAPTRKVYGIELTAGRPSPICPLEIGYQMPRAFFAVVLSSTYYTWLFVL